MLGLTIFSLIRKKKISIDINEGEKNDVLTLPLVNNYKNSIFIQEVDDNYLLYLYKDGVQQRTILTDSDFIDELLESYIVESDHNIYLVNLN